MIPPRERRVHPWGEPEHHALDVLRHGRVPHLSRLLRSVYALPDVGHRNRIEIRTIHMHAARAIGLEKRPSFQTA